MLDLDICFRCEEGEVIFDSPADLCEKCWQEWFNDKISNDAYWNALFERAEMALRSYDAREGLL
jgi:hypothetical protein